MSENTNTPSSIDDGIPEVTFTMEMDDVVQSPVDDTLSIAGMAADAKATGDAIADAVSTLNGTIGDTKTELQGDIGTVEGNVTALPGNLFPVGSIYVSTSSSAPTFGGTNWRWQEIMIPVTYGDLMDGSRSYATIETGDTPGTIHFWMRIADAEVTA
jgi:hypothetical protein